MHVADLDLRDLFLMRFKGGIHRFLDERALLMTADIFGWSRRSLLERLGADEVRTLVTRIGYAWGWQVAETTRLLPWDSYEAWRQAGAHLPALQGLATLEAPDSPIGQLPTYLIWRSSLEAEQHLLHTGISETAVCWLLTGYLAGFFSRSSNSHVICEEDRCRARGDPHCRTVLRTTDATNAEADDACLSEETLQKFLSARAAVGTAHDAGESSGESQDDTHSLRAHGPTMPGLLQAARLTFSPKTTAARSRGK